MEQPNQDIQQMVIDRGMEAKAFYEYFQNNHYISSLFEAFKIQAIKEMASLKPDQQMEFTILKSQMSVPDDLINRVRNDIEAGERELANREGTAEPAKGLL